MTGHHTLFSDFNVSRETYDALKAYQRLLEKWTTRINLISKSTREDVWARHICDSAQVMALASKHTAHWVDIGSGGGLPGLVVAILAKELNPKLRVTLIESDQRKAVFLRTVARELQLNATVQAKRIEAVGPLKADVISARALADLNDLLRLTHPFMTQNTQCLFMKGKNWSKEVKEAEKSWQFQAERFISKTNHEAVILSVRNVTGAPHSK
jgi:16S rRNA (guanine527-N7)-methyltransferase